MKVGKGTRTRVYSIATCEAASSFLTVATRSPRATTSSPCVVLEEAVDCRHVRL
jgi:hypothetical protein